MCLPEGESWSNDVAQWRSYYSVDRTWPEWPRLLARPCHRYTHWGGAPRRARGTRTTQTHVRRGLRWTQGNPGTETRRMTMRVQSSRPPGRMGEGLPFPETEQTEMYWTRYITTDRQTAPSSVHLVSMADGTTVLFRDRVSLFILIVSPLKSVFTSRQ